MRYKSTTFSVASVNCITFERTAARECFVYAVSGALSVREMFVKHDTNQMKRTRKYSGFSVIISALD